MIKLDAEARTGLTICGIPDRMHGGIIRYFELHNQPGSFLQAVLEDSLMNACIAADEENMQLLPAYAKWLFMHAPARSYNIWGSKDAVKNWLAATAIDAKKEVET